MISYDYSTRSLSHFALKKIDGACKKNDSRTTLIGVFCKGCSHYCGTKGGFIICDHPDHRDDADADNARKELHEQIEHRALCALDC